LTISRLRPRPLPATAVRHGCPVAWSGSVRNRSRN
jgi:hypothetical protein